MVCELDTPSAYRSSGKPASTPAPRSHHDVESRRLKLSGGLGGEGSPVLLRAPTRSTHTRMCTESGRGSGSRGNQLAHGQTRPCDRDGGMGVPPSGAHTARLGQRGGGGDPDGLGGREARCPPKRRRARRRQGEPPAGGAAEARATRRGRARGDRAHLGGRDVADRGRADARTCRSVRALPPRALDGLGYPTRRSGAAIPLEGRILAVITTRSTR